MACWTWQRSEGHTRDIGLGTVTFLVAAETVVHNAIFLHNELMGHRVLRRILKENRALNVRQDQHDLAALLCRVFQGPPP